MVKQLLLTLYFLSGLIPGGSWKTNLSSDNIGLLKSCRSLCTRQLLSEELGSFLGQRGFISGPRLRSSAALAQPFQVGTCWLLRDIEEGISKSFSVIFKVKPPREME